MRYVSSRPALLALALLLIVGSIVFIETRLRSSNPADVASASQSSQSSNTGGETTASNTPGPQTEQTENSQTSQTASPPPTTEHQGTQGSDGVTKQTLAEKEAKYPRAKDIKDPTGFINTDGVSIGGARGEKVILLDFWTYSCINCQHTQPYLNAWQDRYAGDGLQIIGVHRPEFGFEKDPANVEAAVREAGIKYPVVLDNNSATWNAYNQSYWPTMYLIDSDGFIRYKHIGEGAYKETEAEIQKLLAEKNHGVVSH